MMVNIFKFGLVLFFTAACSTTLKVPNVELSGQQTEAIVHYAKVLQNYVNDAGQVDFNGLAKDRRHLDLYIKYVAETPFDTFKDPNTLKAHLLNGYNALSMFTVIERGIPKTNSGLNKVRFFYNTKMTVGTQQMSLYSLENKVVRPLGDPRVHFALNCMSVSCPVLPRKPFFGPTLEKQLDKETRQFFAEKRNFTVDHEKKQVFLSEILDFFTEDFITEENKTLVAFANIYRESKVPVDYKVEFFDYDWTINNSHILMNKKL